jgi:hypothetical protein
MDRQISEGGLGGQTTTTKKAYIMSIAETRILADDVRVVADAA